MKNILVKAIVAPSLVASAVVPLSIVATNKTINFSGELLKNEPKNESATLSTSVNESGKKRYIIVNDSQLDTGVTSSLTEFYTDTPINNIKFKLSTTDWVRFSVTGVEKIVMGGKDLVEGTDYVFDTATQEVQLLETESTKTLYTIYVTPKVEPAVYGCEIVGKTVVNPKEEEKEFVDNDSILDFEVFQKVSAAESFVVRLKFKQEAWNDGWTFSAVIRNSINIMCGNGMLTYNEDFTFKADPSAQYLDITIKAGVVYGDIYVQPTTLLVLGNPRPDTDQTFDLNIYAEGKLLQTLTDVITYENKEPEFVLSIAQIDPDGMRKFDIYSGSVKMVTEETGDEQVQFDWVDKNEHKIQLHLTDFIFLGDIELNIDVQLRSDSSSARDTFSKDSWREIDTLEQFFGEDTDAFARAYQLEHLSQFKNFEKNIYCEGYDPWEWDDGFLSKQTARVVSVNQMPLAGDNKDITTASEKKAYFTFMSNYCLSSRRCPEAKRSYYYTYYVKRQEFESYMPFGDDDANCWYRTNPPTSAGKSSDIRTFMNKHLAKDWLKPELNQNLSSYVKHIANRTIVESDKDESTEQFPEKYINDTFFIPTATQLGFKKRTYKECGYIMETDNDGDRVFQIYQGKNWDKGSAELVRSATTQVKRKWTFSTQSWEYWLATPASNGGVGTEKVAIIKGDEWREQGFITKDYYHDPETWNPSVVPCFCI